jgi:membrane protease YdiL (CAAX protease family)
MNKLFYNDNGRLRSGWRAAVFLVFFVIVALMMGFAGEAILTERSIDATPGTATFLVVNGILSLIPAVFVGWLAGRYLEQLPYRALGASLTKGWFTHWLIGLLLGTLTLGLAVLIAWVPGALAFQINLAGGRAIASSMAFSLLIFSIAAAFEEALFRGYILQTFSRSGLAWLAILLTSLLFGYVHLRNPGSNYFAVINTVLAGIWFGVAYLKTRDLWFVWGLHLMWNWMQGAFFGVEVSGITEVSLAPLLKEIDSGPSWLTGGTYGLEAGVACTAALLISTVAIYFMPGIKPDREMLILTSPMGEVTVDTTRFGS